MKGHSSYILLYCLLYLHTSTQGFPFQQPLPSNHTHTRCKRIPHTERAIVCTVPPLLTPTTPTTYLFPSCLSFTRAHPGVRWCRYPGMLVPCSPGLPGLPCLLHIFSYVHIGS
ncbi:hypothetical protein F5X98DRAFT_279795 [Xylaria grammica]|nr:hypothetical protein F5X98DRAFT_279795 [Xylaria grammica]